MDDVAAIGFASALSLEAMRDALDEGISGVAWSMGESHYEGDYVRGRTQDEVKLRILAEADGFCIEVYFPVDDDGRSRLADPRKHEVMRWLEARVLPVLQARDSRPA